MPYRFTAFLSDPDAERPDNPIHSTAGGREHGFQGALVGGVHIYGWTSGALIELLGDEWLERGWIDITFRKPVHDGDLMTVNLHLPCFTVTNANCEVCVEGEAGLADPPFALCPPPFADAEPPCERRPMLTLDNAPVGKPLRPMSVAWSETEQRGFIDQWIGDAPPLFCGENGHCHPSWVARQPIDLLHHSYDYGPAIHTNSKIRYLQPARLGQQFTVTGQGTDAFDRRGHHYIVNDCCLWDETGTAVVLIRHTAIFRLRTA